ncbi:MAG TPA: heavy metal translocating P-type ATPase [Microvirga sp.]|jgi:Cu2+-exporting ATPase|nr:heavy metal translocating P-type ATPase [Microvirga sp.]
MCCADLATASTDAQPIRGPGFARDLSPFVIRLGDDLNRVELAVEGIRCAACMGIIERGLPALPGVTKARLNYSDRRLAVEWNGDLTVERIVDALDRLGYKAHPFDPKRADDEETKESKRLIRALAVAGFASMNIMLMAVSVWAGNGSDITPETRDFFHWMQAVIALPAAAYAGRPFYESAIRGLRAGRVNMDFPITLGVVLTMIMSVVETMNSATHAYFDGAVMLLFFLLIGRVLDQTMRRKTRTLAENLSALRSETAAKIFEDGIVRDAPLSAIAPGDRVLVRPGERIAVDGVVEEGSSELDQSLVTGETMLAAVTAGERVYAGALNATGALTVRVTAAASGTLLDEVESLMNRALEAKSAALVLADKATRLYVPFVHAAAALTLLGWLVAGAGFHFAILAAVAVLIITCPCALGLAIPAVQVVAAGALFRQGVLLNTGDALERLAEVDTVVFDKTGTLTLPEPSLVGIYDSAVLERAARLALSSRHPMAGALAAAVGERQPYAQARETAGLGVSAVVDGCEIRLGSPRFCGAEVQARAALERHPEASVICFREGGAAPSVFLVRQALRDDAVETVEAMRRGGYRLTVLSGDRAAAVAGATDALGIAEWAAELTPKDKIARIEALKKGGRRVLMVGDGINDAPALAAADVSLSPVTAAHVSQAAADGLFMGRRLAPVIAALGIGRKARRLMVQNLAFSALYNVAAIPLAAAGFLTPLIAALAMSGSSVVVTLNALRARNGMRAVAARPRRTAGTARTGRALQTKTA